MNAMTAVSVNTYDYVRSFIQFTVDAWSNTPRTAVDACCTVTTVDGATRTFMLGNACIGENMYVREDLVQQPGTEFLQIVSHDQFMFIKDAGGAKPDVLTAHRVGQVMPTYDGKGVTLKSIDISMVECTRCEPILSHEQACKAILDNQVINARTSYTDADDGSIVVMEYPVRCCNVAPEEAKWQVDTGRILTYAGRSASGHEIIECMAPAYIVCNDWDRAELAMQTLSHDGSRAARYDDIRHIEVKNELFIVS